MKALRALTTRADRTKRESQDSRYLTGQDEIINCLKIMRDQRTELTLRLDEQGDTLSCRILDVAAGGFLVEDIRPRNALAVMRGKPRFSISARDQGTYAFMEDLRVTAAGEERGLPYFHVPLPRRVLFQQRRRAARFSLPMRVSTNGANATLFRATPMTGRLIDISVGGCRVAFEPPYDDSLELEETIAECCIALPPVLEIHSEVIVRHRHKRKDHVLVCGLEMTKMHVTDRRRLEQFIQSLRRTSPAPG